ncbi:unnamed protein product [Hydatigera taeniaeformis]|uniref:Uncharacterized protein n=1 Tax=Hydatigena taeniaeformis TaxID=6205 RepID=A0A0R3X175_HYDTA|nr:unnamed protein product [Hydatigera taeniaeformis]
MENDEGDTARTVSSRSPSLDLKKRLLLRGQHFHLFAKTADHTSHILHADNPENGGEAAVTEAPFETSSMRPTISPDLKAQILQRVQSVHPSEEEFYDDIGSGEESNAEEMEEQ